MRSLHFTCLYTALCLKNGQKNYREITEDKSQAKQYRRIFTIFFWVVFKHFAKGAQNKISTYSTTNGRITNSDLSSKKYTRKNLGCFQTSVLFIQQR